MLLWLKALLLRILSKRRRQWFVSVVMVTELRDETGAGMMMDCERALTITRGDIEKATKLSKRKALQVLITKPSVELHPKVW